jgi:hypothetical protein
MAPPEAPTTGGNAFVFSMIALFIAALVAFVGSFWWASCKTMPIMNEGFTYVTSLLASAGQSGSAPVGGFQNGPAAVEGFAGPAVGAGQPDCMRSSKDCAALYDLLSSRSVTTEEGPDDLRELKVILSKISCFKRDLTGAAGVVHATYNQKFATSHDLEPVAETTARCFAKTIPQRDLALSLDKWGSRGTFLIKRLCTSENLSESEEKEALRLFGDAMADINDIALGVCCNGGKVMIAGQEGPRMVSGYEDPSISGLREYKGYY